MPVVITLNVEPGMYRSWYAWASSGLPGVSWRSVMICWATSKSAFTNVFGSNVGLLYIARIAPVFGSITVIEPVWPPSRNLAASWASLRIASSTVPADPVPPVSRSPRPRTCCSVVDPVSTSPYIRSTWVEPNANVK